MIKGHKSITRRGCTFTLSSYNLWAQLNQAQVIISFNFYKTQFLFTILGQVTLINNYLEVTNKIKYYHVIVCCKKKYYFKAKDPTIILTLNGFSPHFLIGYIFICGLRPESTTRVGLDSGRDRWPMEWAFSP